MNRTFLKRSTPLFINGAIMAICLLVPTGRWGWPNAWALIALSSLSGAAAGAVIAADPGLAAERRNARAGKSWDKPLVGTVVLLGPMATWITAGIEHRHSGSDGMPLAISATGLLVAAGGSALIVWAMKSNTYFSAVVRIQTDRGQSVVSNGPYRFVRHPGYLGMSAFMLATPVILASRLALVPATLTVCLNLLRTALEDRTLQTELPGYAEYADRVRYRLVPLVW